MPVPRSSNARKAEGRKPLFGVPPYGRWPKRPCGGSSCGHRSYRCYRSGSRRVGRDAYLVELRDAGIRPAPAPSRSGTGAGKPNGDGAVRFPKGGRFPSRTRLKAASRRVARSLPAGRALAKRLNRARRHVPGRVHCILRALPARGDPASRGELTGTGGLASQRPSARFASP